MHVSEITVSAGRTFNHPYESYANFKPSVTVRALVEPGEDWQEVTKALQAKAEMIVEDHKRHLLKSLEEIEQMGRRQAEAARLDKQIRECQERLDRLREGEAVPDQGRAIEYDADDRPY